MSRFIVNHQTSKIAMALCEAGIIKDDPNYIRRIVIDLEHGSAARIYVERFADDSIGEVLLKAGLLTALAKDDE